MFLDGQEVGVCPTGTLRQRRVLFGGFRTVRNRLLLIELFGDAVEAVQVPLLGCAESRHRASILVEPKMA